ncbi:hypothetical protein J2W25_000861 [Variovorax boronicumulans]|uniref:Uncharacterized protein n=1 Tax=Variovorax boronicumulans TaxID=436515 RepID=A0AAW8DQV5_9BURK|nr:hypothetical protein [Variovorax boronicumulans]MDP9921846.1 hypothetical protein [Variovorax boronicumulans]
MAAIDSSVSEPERDDGVTLGTSRRCSTAAQFIAPERRVPLRLSLMFLDERFYHAARLD